MRHVPVSAPPAVAIQEQNSGSEGGGQLSFGVIFMICVVAFVGTKVAVGSFLYWKWSRTKNVCEVRVSGGKLIMFQGSGKQATPSSKDILKKTEGLTKKDVIGSGGYGVVYKLVMDDNCAYAVKKLSRGGCDNDRGFERELETLSDIKHRNLVSLRGYYSAPQVNLLVYDLMVNGSLDDHLHDRRDDEEPLDWPTRLNIALGAARGLAYLHHDCIPHIIHRDIKASNILLDEDMEAHVADFGLAKLINPRETHVTTVIAGTLGYLAPEYIETGRITDKSDIYSYGVVLLELITGKRPSHELFQEFNLSMLDWVKEAYESAHASECFDDDLVGFEESYEQLTQLLALALECLNPNPKVRPDMLQVVKMLEMMQADCTRASGVRYRKPEVYRSPSTEEGSSRGTLGSTENLIPHHSREHSLNPRNAKLDQI